MEANEIARRLGHIEIGHTFDVLEKAIRHRLDLKDKIPGHAWTIGRWLSEGRRLNKGMMNKPKASNQNGKKHGKA